MKDPSTRSNSISNATSNAKIRVILFSLAVTIIGLCLSGSVSAQAKLDTTVEAIPSFKTDIWPTFVVKCNNDDCHGQRGSAFPKFHAYLMIKSKSKKILKKFEDQHDPMPPADAPIPITDVEVERIRKWIEAGAPENTP